MIPTIEYMNFIMLFSCVWTGIKKKNPFVSSKGFFSKPTFAHNILLVAECRQVTSKPLRK